jgi:UDP-glucose 4-epimerase
MAERCLVTGERGFLGRFVCGALEAAGYEVVGLGARRLPDSTIADFVGDCRPDVVVHLAGPASVHDSFRDPQADFSGAVDATASLVFGLARANLRPRLVHVSSAAVYGNPERLPIDERASLRPISPYGHHRKLSEAVVDEALALFGIGSCVARIFSAYGPGLPRQVVHDLCARAVVERRIHLDGTGDESRDFVHAADVARAIVALVERGSFDGTRYNVASGRETTLRELVETVAAITGISDVRFSGQARQGDPLRWVADVRRLREVGWEPQVALEDGIRDVCGWLAASG